MAEGKAEQQLDGYKSQRPLTLNYDVYLTESNAYRMATALKNIVVVGGSYVGHVSYTTTAKLLSIDLGAAGLTEYRALQGSWQASSLLHTGYNHFMLSGIFHSTP